jgi:hypothetical protein
MADQPPDLPPRDPSPEDRDLSRRSGALAVGPWLAIAVIALIGLAVFVVSALGG